MKNTFPSSLLHACKGLCSRTLPPAGAPLPPSHIVRAAARGLAKAALKLTHARKNHSADKKLCQTLARHFQVQQCVLSQSGRSGLSHILQALQACLPEKEQKSRTEVLIPAYVSYSVPSAVVHAGFTVRLYDIDPTTLGPDLSSVQQALSEKTLAVVLCHQFGLLYDAAPLQNLAEAHGAFLVDDAAQAMGGMVGKDYAGTMGHVGLFSLSRGKAVTAVEGGIILVPKGQQAQRITTALERNMTAHRHQEPKLYSYTWQVKSWASTCIKASALVLLRQPYLYTLPASLPWLHIGASIFEPHFENGPMCSFSKELTLDALPLMEQSHGRRRRKAARYTQLLQKNTSLQPLTLETPTRPVYVRYPLLPKAEKEVCIQRILAHEGGVTAKKFGISRGFPLALCDVAPLQEHLSSATRADKDRLFPHARHVAQNLITLPTHEHVREGDMQRIAEFLAQMCQD